MAFDHRSSPESALRQLAAASDVQHLAPGSLPAHFRLLPDVARLDHFTT